jgi:hypothetical protein
MALNSRSLDWLLGFQKLIYLLPWRRGLVVSSPPATEEIGALGREIESCQVGFFEKKEKKKFLFDCDVGFRGVG